MNLKIQISHEKETSSSAKPDSWQGLGDRLAHRNADAEEKKMPGVHFTHKSHRSERSTSGPHRPPARTLQSCRIASRVYGEPLCNAARTLGAKSQLHGGGLQAYLRLATIHHKQEQNPLIVHSVYRYFLPRSRPPAPTDPTCRDTHEAFASPR